MYLEGVDITFFDRHRDERGYLEELWSFSAFKDFHIRQVTHSYMRHGVIKAWHWHRRQTDVWIVLTGVLRLVLYDPRPNSRTYGKVREDVMSSRQLWSVSIPPEVWHGCKVIEAPCHLIYITDRKYDPDDEFRAPHDADPPGYDWLKGAPIT